MQRCRGSSGRRLPHLCAGRRPSRPARLSGAPAAGERRQLLLRRRSPPIPPCRSRRLLQRPADIIGSPDNARASAKMPLPRDLYGPSGEFARRRVRPPAPRKLSANAAAAGTDQAVPLDRRRAAPEGALGVTPSMAMTASARAEATQTADRRDGCRAAAFAPGAARRPRRAPRRSSAPPTCSSSGAAHFIALLQREGGKTLDDALSEVREAVDFCRYYAARGPQAVRRGAGAAGTDRREQRAAAARARRVRRDLAVEFSAGDLPRPGHRGADGRQYAWSPSPPSRRR